jgi:hypothetical protein
VYVFQEFQKILYFPVSNQRFVGVRVDLLRIRQRLAADENAGLRDRLTVFRESATSRIATLAAPTGARIQTRLLQETHFKNCPLGLSLDFHQTSRSIDVLVNDPLGSHLRGCSWDEAQSG